MRLTGSLEIFRGLRFSTKKQFSLLRRTQPTLVAAYPVGQCVARAFDRSFRRTIVALVHCNGSFAQHGALVITSRSADSCGSKWFWQKYGSAA
jgi:hypothetical protein